ncbi:MAG: hypothetical protein ACRC28_12585 [Clostridium sp.]|uniref:hypothetical protein n=1 Tax=Clostridium sp. TaxID=1506 RepID=UPI003F406AD6
MANKVKQVFCKHVYREYIQSGEDENGRIKVVMCKKCKKIKEKYFEEYEKEID